MSDALEQDWLEHARDGDPHALEQLLVRHERRLYNVALRMVSHPEDAADVTQEAMLKIIRSIDSFRGESQITTWMIRITMNAATSHLRKRRIRQTLSLDAPLNGRHAAAGDNGDGSLLQHLQAPREHSPDCRVQQREEMHMVRHAIETLDPDARAVLVLRDVDGMDYEEIARVLDLKLGTVKSRLFRARLALREAVMKMERGVLGGIAGGHGVAAGGVAIPPGGTRGR